ncbi:hypothetical protein GGR92_004263 [Spirosoma lacussanchae]|uniref:glycosyltransferase family 87 protein n=1 Tax=Spirosoma lacussanchae TaxID=1884249 RepID=UPI00110941EA|nr:glycosyltransferase family 87 protein [Spirosoma lacussanchae]
MNRSRFQKVILFFGREPVLLTVYGLITLLASIQQYLLTPVSVAGSEQVYTHYNNYIIFRNSFFHLLGNQNLYTYYLAEQWDLYKYSPTFALLMAPLAWLPNWLGLFFWNALNTLVLFFGIKHLPRLARETTVKLRWFVLIELLTSIQNSQSNGLILGMLIWSFIFLERGQLIWATLLMLGSVFIKIFGVVAFMLFLLYPRKPAAVAYTLVWTLILLLLPLVVITGPQLLNQYQNWWVMLQADHSSSLGYSVMGWLSTWFSAEPPKLLVVGLGAVLLLAPLARLSLYADYGYRLLLLASVLIWVVIFNHKAESPTFIIAMGGVAIWYFTRSATALDRVLVLLAFVFTSLSPTDVFPAGLRQSFVEPYVFKGVFCMAIWARLTYKLLTYDKKPTRPELIPV